MNTILTIIIITVIIVIFAISIFYCKSKENKKKRIQRDMDKIYSDSIQREADYYKR